jgi:hypothetical protein
MQNHHNKPVKIQQKWSRGEVAEMYGISTNAFMGWLEERNYKLRPRKAINQKEFDEILLLFGDPREYSSKELAKLQTKRGRN